MQKPFNKQPSAVGVYKVIHKNLLNDYYSYWNGMHWCFVGLSEEGAYNWKDAISTAITRGSYVGWIDNQTTESTPINEKINEVVLALLDKQMYNEVIKLMEILK